MSSSRQEPPLSPNGIVYFWYPSSPFARRVKWYMALRNIDYAGCLQPVILPRPDLTALGVSYRRTPTMAIGRDIYLDSRSIIARLEQLFPPSEQHPPLSSPETEGLAALLNKFAIDGGLMMRAVQLLTIGRGKEADAFRRDRDGFYGPGFKIQRTLDSRSEGLVHMRQCFAIVESLLVDGREWIAGTMRPGLADIEGVWCIDFVISQLRPPKEYFSELLYPRVYAWNKRFQAAVKAAEARRTPTDLSGASAVKQILDADFTDTELGVDPGDPLRLEAGTQVKLYPTDGGGYGHHDQGRLIKLTRDEVAISAQAPSGEEVRIHAPRWQFRVEAVAAESKL